MRFRACLVVGLVLVATVAGTVLVAQQSTPLLRPVRGQVGTDPNLVLPLPTTGPEKAPAAPLPQRPGAPPPPQTGVIALYNGGISIVDARTFLVYGPFLEGQLGSAGGGLFDVVLTKTGGKGMISNFGDAIVNFVDLRIPGNPVFLGATALPFFAEDMALSPNQKFLLVTDGGFSDKMAVLNVATRGLVEYFDLSPYSFYANAVAIAKDNQTVMAADYFTGAVGVLTMDPLTGMLGYIGSASILPMRPVNVTISPNGLTAVMNSAVVDSNPDPGDPVIDMGIVMRILGPGAVLITGVVPPPDAVVTGTQSMVFSRDGSKLYWLGNGAPDPGTGIAPHFVYVYNVIAPGVVAYSGTAIPVGENGGSSQLFGVDVMSIDPKGEFLYVSNQTVSGASHYVNVIDLATNRQVLAIVPGLIDIVDSLPTGISFK